MRLNQCLLCSICTSELNHEKISFHRTNFKDNRTQPSLMWIPFSLYDETCVLEDPTTECEFRFEMCSHRTRRWNIFVWIISKLRTFFETAAENRFSFISLLLQQRDREWHRTHVLIFLNRCLEMKKQSEKLKSEFGFLPPTKKKTKIESKFSNVCNKVGNMHSLGSERSRLFNLTSRIAKRRLFSEPETRIRSWMERSQII